MVVIALLTTMVGLLFKIAAVPFHQWAPDAYEGAPTSITGFMSVAVKAAAWALLLRILVFGLWPLRSIYTPIIVIVAIATMTGAQLRRAHADEHQTAARLLLDCARRLHAAGVCGHGNLADRQPGL